MSVSAALLSADLLPCGFGVLAAPASTVRRGGQLAFGSLRQNNTVHSPFVLALWGDGLAPFLPLSICNFLTTEHEHSGFYT